MTVRFLIGMVVMVAVMLFIAWRGSLLLQEDRRECEAAGGTFIRDNGPVCIDAPQLEAP